jgi:hypothetical protein
MKIAAIPAASNRHALTTIADFAFVHAISFDALARKIQGEQINDATTADFCPALICFFHHQHLDGHIGGNQFKTERVK